jgi:ribose transport system ATP-binding protein
MVGISKRFAGVQALKNVNFEVYPSEIVGLIGENGAGKSTLMKVLGGIHTPDEGQVYIEGQPVRIENVAASIRHGISFVHQELNVLDNIDVAGNVFLGREPLMGGPLMLINRKQMQADTQPFLDQIGFRLPCDTVLDKLSIAQQQLVEIAKALSLNAKVLVMDEPTSSLTLTETERLLSLIRELKSRGVAIVYISHRLSEIIGFADRVVGLRDGRNAGELAPAEISHDAMVRLMVGRDLARTSTESYSTDRVRLKVRNLRTRRYPQREVSFDIHGGEILGMAGLVGAGRSELAQAIFGVDAPVSGEIELDGQPLVVKSARDAIDSGIYLAPEDRRRSGVIVEMSLRENVTMAAMGRYSTVGLIRGGAEAAASTEAISSLSIKAPSVETLVQNLSGGNQQKVVLAKWLLLQPKVLIFDEPTRGIDVGAKAEIYDLMHSLAKEGVAILMISSDMEEVLGLSDRIAVMHEGRLSGILTRSEADEEAVMNLAVGKTNAS